ncbi:MAG TPA: tetratricopeptide repeat protein [Pyrinomonadaceae bacterium]|nr:tetratricopeptide repeat protein [Pyrinomonadaceae bacterium]
MTTKAARPTGALAKRSVAEKAPVRKATPVKKSSTAAKPARATSSAKPSKAASQARPAAAATKTRAEAASKTKQPARPAAKKGAHAPTAAAPTAQKARPSKSAPKQTPAPKPPAKPASRTATPPPRQPTVDEAAALKAFERAHKEFTRGHFSEARMLFRALIEQHGGVSEVTARARIYLNIAESRLRTETALPRDAESLYDRGVIELNRGEYVAAQEMFERALKREPEAADTHYALAAARARLGSVELALQSLERAVNLKPALRVRAQHDADLVALRNEPDFERIIFPASRP